jgi:hypothetical protein
MIANPSSVAELFGQVSMLRVPALDENEWAGETTSKPYRKIPVVTLNPNRTIVPHLRINPATDIIDCGRNFD